MKSSIVHRRGLMLLAGTLLVLAGIAWGAAYRPYAHVAQTPTVASTTPSPAAVATAAPVATTIKATPRAAETTPTPEGAPLAGQAGMRVFIDPQTGEIGPPTQEALEQMAHVQGEVTDIQLPQVQLPDGSWMLVNDNKIVDAMVVTVDKGGHKTFTCVDNVPNEKVAFDRVQKNAPTPQREDR